MGSCANAISPISRTNILQYPQAPYVPLPDYVLLHSPVAWPDRVITLPTAESYQERKMVRKPSRGAVAQYMRPGKSSSTARALNQLAVDEAVVEPAKRTSIVSRVVQWRQHHAQGLSIHNGGDAARYATALSTRRRRSLAWRRGPPETAADRWARAT